MFLIKAEKMAEANKNFRQVLWTGEHSQCVIMYIREGEDIGNEVHKTTDQWFFIVEGTAEVSIGNETSTAEEDDVFVVPAGMYHNIKNNGHEDLKLYTIYTPPMHPDKLVVKKKSDLPEELYMTYEKR